ncbi:MAG: lamin tail domain-containing protein, partial [Candidatus Thermoplasmatota archaeon]|nr:lamin tail domain-containing protein [Candidatus Thermoplasmatota archaeon]
MSHDENDLRNALAASGTGFALPGDHGNLSAIVNRALKEGYAIIVVTAGPGSGRLSEGLTEDERERLVIVDWEAYKARSIVGVEEESGILYCARGLVNVNMAVNKAMGLTAKFTKRAMITDALPTMVGLFGEILAYDFLSKNLAKLGAKNIAGIYVAPESFFSDPEMRAFSDQLVPIERSADAGEGQRVAKTAIQADTINVVLDKLGVSREALETDFQDDFDIWLCFECGAFVDKNATVCPICAAPVKMAVHTDEHAMMKTENVVSKCPDCGVPVHVKSDMCGVCGRVFSEKDRENMLGQGLMNAIEEMKNDEDLGFLVCQECNSFVSKDKTDCGICGARIDRKTAREAGSEEQVADELSNLIVAEFDSLESNFGEKNFIMCPECGASVEGSRERCSICGFDLTDTEKIELEVGKNGIDIPEVKKAQEEEDTAPDGHWYKERKSLFMCPMCGTFLTAGVSKCHGCGVEFEEELEDAPISEGHICPECGAAVTQEEESCSICKSPLDRDGFWYRKEGGIFMCPGCGSFLAEDAGRCNNCGTEFEKESEHLPEEDVTRVCPNCREPLGPDAAACGKCGFDFGKEKEHDDFWYRERDELFMCPGCGSFISQSSGLCNNCGLEFADDVGDEEPIAQSVAETEAEQKLFICPECGSLVSASATLCPNCDLAFEEDTPRTIDAEIMELDNMLVLPEQTELSEEARNEIDELDNMLVLTDGEIPLPEHIGLSEEAGNEIDELNEMLVLADEQSADTPLEHDVPRPTEINREIEELSEMLVEVDSYEADDGVLTELDALDMEIDRICDMLVVEGGDFEQIVPEPISQPDREEIEELGEMLVMLEEEHAAESGLENDFISRRRKGRGMTNGLTNGLGRTNGMTNGLGRTNGRTNGMTNGMVNGMGRTNGLTNGMTNGLTNGLAQGLPTRVATLQKMRRRQIRMYRIALVVILVIMISILPALSGMFDSGPSMPINIDGNFSDWEKYTTYTDSYLDVQAKPGINIIGAKAVFDTNSVFAFLEFGGDALAGSNGSVDTILGLVDLDGDENTGYAAYGLGADLAVDLYGWDNAGKYSRCMVFDDAAGRDNWNGFTNFGGAQIGIVGAMIEIRMPVPRASEYSEDEARMVLLSLDEFGDSDLSDFVISAKPGSITALVQDIAPDIVSPGTVPMLSAALQCHGTDSVLRGFNFTLDGFGPTDVSAMSLHLDANANSIIDSGENTIPLDFIILDNSTVRLLLRNPLEMRVGADMNFIVSANIGTGTMGKTGDILLDGLNVDGAVSQVKTGRMTRHNIGQPAGMAVDGAFGDWVGLGGILDDINDQKPSGNGTLANANVDLAEARAVLDGELFVYLSVSGRMLGGSTMPVLRHRPADIVSVPMPDSDRDTIPNDMDPYPLDFTNNGIPDPQMITTDNLPDIDGDGWADYPGGTDLWLNTTIPAGLPEPYAGKNVSIYIGRIESKHVEKKGDDLVYVLLNTDDDVQTGLNLKGGWGIDYSIVVSGKGNRILASELYKYDPASLPTGWAFVDNVSAALDWTRMEGAVSLTTLGIAPGQSFTVYISTEDWKGSHDEMGTPLDSSGIGSVYPLTGTRSPAGDNVVLNEISSLPNIEWVEVCNPTNAALDISGWTIYSSFASPIYTFPAGTIIGAWGSGTEYYIAQMTQNNRLPNTGTSVTLRSGATIIDATTYPAMALGQTWSRFKNATYGMPTDTDNDANDWYTSNNAWTVPEGPTPGAPNDRRRPIINIDKIGDTSTAPINGQVTFTLFYNNTGDGNARNVWVNDTLPAGMSYVSSSVPYDSVLGNTYRWHFINVAPGTHSFTITAIIDLSVPVGTVLTNLAELAYTDQLSRPMGTSSDTWDVTVADLAPEITVVKIADAAVVSPGDMVTYTIYYNNTGFANAGNVWVNDTLPAGLTFVSASPAPGSIIGQTQYWYFTNVAPGQYSIVLQAQVGLGVVPGTVLMNTATLDYKNAAGQSMPGSSSQATITVVAPWAKLVINEICSLPNPEWVELCNPTDTAVDVSGWTIYSNFATPIYTFPTGTIIGAWGSGTEYYVAQMTQNNRLSDGGATVTLQSGATIIDATTYPVMALGQTWSRFKHEDTGYPVDTGSDATDWYISNNAWLVPEGPTP